MHCKVRTEGLNPSLSPPYHILKIVQFPNRPLLGPVGNNHLLVARVVDRFKTVFLFHQFTARTMSILPHLVRALQILPINRNKPSSMVRGCGGHPGM